MFRRITTIALAAMTLMGCDEATIPETQAFVPVTAPARALRFEAACDEGDRVTIVAVGDLLLNSGLQIQALDHGRGHASLWSPVQDLIDTADIAYVNFEGTTSCCMDPELNAAPDPGAVYDGVVYTAHPTFNYHSEIATALVDSGFEVVSTANNHSMDRGPDGVDQTVIALREAGMPLTGTRTRDDRESPWYVITEAKGFRIAWVSCTNGLNLTLDRMSWRSDDLDQVLQCTQEADRVDAIISELDARPDIDAVIAVPHCGGQWDPEPTGKLAELVPRLIKAGALAVLATSPHDLSYWEKRPHPSGREAFAIYSLGNFISGQQKLPRRATMLLYLGLTRGSDGQTRINGVRYVPAVMARDGSRWELQAVDRTTDHQLERDHIRSWYGLWNLSPPTVPVDTTPQCRTGWAPPARRANAAGERCTYDDECGEGLHCDAGLPNRACTALCEDSCPQRAGSPIARCVMVEDVGPRCLTTCSAYNDCRELYACIERPVASATERVRVCYPEPPMEEEDP